MLFGLNQVRNTSGQCFREVREARREAVTLSKCVGRYHRISGVHVNCRVKGQGRWNGA